MECMFADFLLIYLLFFLLIIDFTFFNSFSILSMMGNLVSPKNHDSLNGSVVLQVINCSDL